MWAGGKTKVLKHYAPYFPTSFDTYYEPFFGGGAVFIHMVNEYQPKNIVINDINPDIVRIYTEVRDNYNPFIERMEELEAKYMPLEKADRKKLYYDIREEHAWDYDKWNPTTEAATLYFLMKTGFNGVYQLNKNTNGRYGTPSGLLNQKKEVFNRDVLSWWNTNLQGVTINSVDWSESVVDDPNGFFFFDPPYRDSFADYGNGFGDDDLMKLIEFSDRQDKVFLANRADDDWFDGKSTSLKTHYFDITYTVGRRKATADGYQAKKAREILLYKTDRLTLC